VAAVWTQTQVAGSTTTTGTSIGSTSISIPPGARLARVVLRIIAGGIDVSTSSPLNTPPIYFECAMTLAGGSYGSRQLFRSYQVLRQATSCVYAADQVAGVRIINYAHHSGGDKELGCDLQMSYGDATHLAGTVTLTGGFYKNPNNGGGVVITRTIVMRTLHFT
jgi:hypothetical protein